MSVNHTVVTRFCQDCRQSYPYKEVHVCPVAPTAPAPIIKKVEDELIGTVLGERYRIENFLSRGGMGTVYLARHIVLDKPVAIKILNDVKDETAQKRFVLEAKAACAVNHEHIVNITDFGVLADGRPYLVMEYLQGQSLDAVIAKGPLSPLRVCRIGEQLAMGLQAVHNKGILHRDLKPGNIYLLERHRRDYVKILDFGIAKVVNDGRPVENAAGPNGEPAVPNRPTQEGMVLGTAEYLAPEQALGEPLDHRADQYALGCILYEMLTGDVPFRGTTAMATVVKRLSEDPVPPRQRQPDLQIPATLEAVALRALSRERDKRFASMSELGQALTRELESLGAPLGADSSGSISANLIAPLLSGSQSAPLMGSSMGAQMAQMMGPATMPMTSASARTIPTQIPSERPTLRSLMRPWLLPRPWRIAVSAGVAMVVMGIVLGLYLGMARTGPRPVPIERKLPPIENTQPQNAGNDTHPTGDTTKDEPDKTPETPETTVEAPNPPKTSPGVSDGLGEELRFVFENASPIDITVSCTKQKPCVMTAQKSCPMRIGNEPGRCEASAPGHKAQSYTFRELRNRARGGRLRERVQLDAKGLGTFKL